jgi:hypothetical protein
MWLQKSGQRDVALKQRFVLSVVFPKARFPDSGRAGL